jgi:hypothetical protein
LRRAALLALVLAVVGCSTLPSGPSFPACPVPLEATWAMPGEFSERYRAWMTDADGHAAEPFELVAELRDERLTLVAWNRFGAELFALRQHGIEVEPVGRPLPGFAVPAERVLADFHRMRFRGEARSDSDGGRRIASCGGETRFLRLDGRGP